MRAIVLRYCCGRMRMLPVLAISYALCIFFVLLGSLLGPRVQDRPAQALLVFVFFLLVVLVLVVVVRTAFRTIGDASETWLQRGAAVAVVVLLGAAVRGAMVGSAPMAH